jgi:hypothetical protein
MSRSRIVALAVFAAVTVLAASVGDVVGEADAKKKKGRSIAGKYKGLTEYDGTVSFRLTRSGKIVGFTLTKATLYCHTDVPSENPTYFPEYTKVVTITHGPMRMKKKSKKNPQGKKFEVSDPAPETRAYRAGYFNGGIVELTSGPLGGRVLNEVGFSGDTSFETTDGPFGEPGTEWCVTKQIDWEAKRPGSKGFVATGESGHNRPPLSEF